MANLRGTPYIFKANFSELSRRPSERADLDLGTESSYTPETFSGVIRVVVGGQPTLSQVL